jgi:hypothetical protein
MATEEQNAANRANANRSTGPVTKEGKRRSSMNSLKHGLSANSVVIDGEEPADFEALHRSLIKAFDPQPGIEDELVCRLVVLFWRLRRIPVFEANFLRRLHTEIIYRDPRLDVFIEDEIARIKIEGNS